MMPTGSKQQGLKGRQIAQLTTGARSEHLQDGVTGKLALHSFLFAQSCSLDNNTQHQGGEAGSSVAALLSVHH